jgi:hypothetical protein
LRWLWLGSELLTPVLEPLLWQALRLAILPLIQVAPLPRLVMRTPECLALPLPRPMLLRHLVLSIFKSMARTDRVRQKQNKCVRNGRLLGALVDALFLPRASLFSQIFSLFDRVGNLGITH